MWSWCGGNCQPYTCNWSTRRGATMVSGCAGGRISQGFAECCVFHSWKSSSSLEHKGWLISCVHWDWSEESLRKPQRTGHRSLDSLRVYKQASAAQQEAVSEAISTTESISYESALGSTSSLPTLKPVPPKYPPGLPGLNLCHVYPLTLVLLLCTVAT